jgi:hypothetical protein
MQLETVNECTLIRQVYGRWVKFRHRHWKKLPDWIRTLVSFVLVGLCLLPVLYLISYLFFYALGSVLPEFGPS